MKQIYDAIDVAKYIANKCINDNQMVSNLQLQKILFFVQKDFVDIGRIAFADSIEAWQFGPVVPCVYYYYCGYGANPIFIINKGQEIMLEDKKRIDKIVELKRVLNPWDLVKETHKPNGAWDRVYKNGKGERQVIDISIIKEYG